MGRLSGLWYSIGCMNLAWPLFIITSVRPPLAAARVVVRVSISCITFDMKDEIIFVHCASPEGGCTWLVRVLNTLFSF